MTHWNLHQTRKLLDLLPARSKAATSGVMRLAQSQTTESQRNRAHWTVGGLIPHMGPRSAGAWSGPDVLRALAAGEVLAPPGFEGSPMAKATEEDRIERLATWIYQAMMIRAQRGEEEARLLEALETRAAAGKAGDDELRAALARAKQAESRFFAGNKDR